MRPLIETLGGKMLDTLNILYCYFHSRFALRKHRAETYANLIQTCSPEDVDRFLDGTLLLKAIEHNFQDEIISRYWHKKAVQLQAEIKAIHKKWDVSDEPRKRNKVLKVF
jgi:hypothetical protein